jgi:polysaccharide biosynthesis/export protein
MNFVKILKSLSLAVIVSLALSVVIFAQEETPTPSPTPKGRERVSKNSPTENPKTDEPPMETKTVEPTQTEPVATETPDPNQTQEDTEDAEIKQAIVQPYVNYLTKYELGPEDVISIEVFGQCDKGLCKTVAISPTAIIYFPFIPGGLFVGGKTTEQVGKEIQKKLDEYIIEPQVTVNLEKVMSAQFAVLGRVATPGVRTMTKRYTVYEAITESGGLLPDADKKRMMLLRRTLQGGYEATPLKLDEMIAGKVPMEILAPGDQIIIPEKKWTLSKIMSYIGLISGVRGMRPF